MDEVARLLVLLALAGGALTLVGGACAWFLDEARRIRRTLKAGLGVEPHPLLIARGRGTGVGFDLPGQRLAVTWDRGGWRLDYALCELTGVELIVDRAVAARAFRGEPRRPLDQFSEPQERVRLRFVFDDPAHPDFALDLWTPEDDGRRGRLDPDAALAEANRWMARLEALLRRVPAARTPTAVATPVPSRPPAAPLFQTDDEDEIDPEDVGT
jgi:hypothetical protein